MPLDTFTPSPADVEAALHEAAPNAANPIAIACSFVLHAPVLDEYVTYALVKDGSTTAFAAGAELYVKEWPVFLVSEHSPIGRAVCDAKPPARLGDCITVRLPGGKNAAEYEAQIVSWNGSPLLSDAERSDCRDTQEREKASARTQADLERKRAALCAKEDGIVANLRARRLEKEATLREALKRVE